MPSSNGSLTNHPTNSAQGIINSVFGGKELSANMKSTITYLRTQITRSFTAASKKLDVAKVYLNDPDRNRNEKDLRKIDILRKELLMLQSVIETDAHFFEVIKTRDVILSEKERSGLREIVSSYFAEKTREETTHDLKLAEEGLRAILVLQEFTFVPALSEAELAELSHDLESFLDGEIDVKSGNGESKGVEEERDNVRNVLSHPEETPILINGIPSAVRSSSGIVMTHSNQNGGLIENSDQHVVPPQIIPLLPPLQEPNARNTVHDPNAQRMSRPSPSSKEAVISSCPCCKQDHELYLCEHEAIRKFCALNGRCIYCTSDKHRSIECDLNSQKSSSAHSVVSHRSHRTGIESCITPPLKASTPYGCGNEKTDQQPTRVSMRKMAQRERTSQEKRPFHPTFSPVNEKPEFGNSKDNNNREGVDSRNNTSGDHSIKLSFKEVLAIVSPFEGDPLDFPRFKDEFDSMVMLNNQLNDTMKLAVLKKKLVGEAKEYLVALYNPSQAVFETLEAMHKAFSEDNTAMNSALQSFRELTFNSVDFKQTAKELNLCKSVLLQMKELGLDTESNTFVRTFVAKIPDKIMRDMRVLFINGREPSTDEVLAHFSEALNDLTFASKFKSGNVSSQGRTKELTNSIMALDASSPQNPRQKKQSTENSKKDSNGKKAVPSENSRHSSNASKLSTPKPENQKAAAGKTKKNSQSNSGNKAAQTAGSAQQNTAQCASNGYGHMNVAYAGYHPPMPQYQPHSYYQGYPNNGHSTLPNWSNGHSSIENQSASDNQLTRSKDSSGNAKRQNLNSARVAKSPAPKPVGLVVGEQIEPCYQSGPGYDKTFIPHTFCRSDQTPNKCCFICGPGHSILQCPIPSFQVRKFLRDTNSCHNCTRQGHTVDDCPSKASCAYCRGNHNTGGCTFKEYYRDINNYPADAPKPVLGTFFRGSKGDHE